jgi:hypothetical protein
MHHWRIARMLWSQGVIIWPCLIPVRNVKPFIRWQTDCLHLQTVSITLISHFYFLFYKICMLKIVKRVTFDNKFMVHDWCQYWTWDIWSMYRAGSLMTVSREPSRCRLDLMGVQEVRWEGSGTAPVGEYTFCMERGIRTMNWVQGFCT